MPEQAMICPQCNAPLTPHRFAKLAKCPYCGTTIHYHEEEVPLSANIFHKSFENWNNPASQDFDNVISIGKSHWSLNEKIAQGDICDVYMGMRARWPTEMAVIKLLRDEKDKKSFENEWQRIKELQQSSAPGVDFFSRLLPQPILHGKITGNEHNGNTVSIFRWESDFKFSLADFLEAYPQGIPVRASIWLWRRILEMLNFIHSSDLVHGAVLPQHILIQENEHGTRLIGYSSSGSVGDSLSVVCADYQACYPKWFKKGSQLSKQADLVMSARCIIAALGGNATQGTLPKAVPAPLAKVILRVAKAAENEKVTPNAWALRDELGQVADNIYGDSMFIPIEMPK